MMWGPGVARVAADLALHGSDRADRRRRPRSRPLRRAGPEPPRDRPDRAAVPGRRGARRRRRSTPPSAPRDELRRHQVAQGPAARGERLADIDPGVRALPHRQHPEAQELTQELAEVRVVADHAGTFGVAGVVDDGLERGEVQRPAQPVVDDDLGPEWRRSALGRLEGAQLGATR